MSIYFWFEQKYSDFFGNLYLDDELKRARTFQNVNFDLGQKLNFSI